MTKKDKIFFILKEFIILTIGMFFVAIAYTWFFDKIGLVPGGVSGIGIMVKHFTDTPLWVTELCLNIPLFILTMIVKRKDKGMQKELGFKTLYGIIATTFFLYVTTLFEFTFTEDILLITVFGSVIAGIGLGLVFSSRGSTGGTDLVSIIIHHFFKHISLGTSMRIAEVGIIFGGCIVFGIEKTMYAIISVYITSKCTDMIINGFKYGKVIYIVSDKYVLISEALMEMVDRGVTGLKAEGMYSHKDKKVLMIVSNKKELPYIKNIVYGIDKNAFLFVTNAHEVLGEGFLTNGEEL